MTRNLLIALLICIPLSFTLALIFRQWATVVAVPVGGIIGYYTAELDYKE